MAENEKTSKTVVSNAAGILKMERPEGVGEQLWEQIRSIAATLLTQASDHLPSGAYEALMTGQPKSKDGLLTPGFFKANYPLQKN